MYQSLFKSKLRPSYENKAAAAKTVLFNMPRLYLKPKQKKKRKPRKLISNYRYYGGGNRKILEREVKSTATREQERGAKCAATCDGAGNVYFWGAGGFFFWGEKEGTCIGDRPSGLRAARRR